MTTAMIMAGGRSARMRSSAGPRHKALVPVLGVPMIERNLCALLSERFPDIVVAMNAREDELAEYIRGRGAGLARARGARLECLVETSPLGTIGAVAALPGIAGAVLVVNVDNLTALSLRELVAFHERQGAAMTIASHLERVQVPCGELELSEGRVLAYREKPAKPVTASSGTYVLGPAARAAMGAQSRWDVPDLVTTLIARGEKVCALPHDAPWIDVNDAASIPRAERLIAEHMDRFEQWGEQPVYEVAALLLVSPSRVRIHARDGGCAIPVERVRADDVGPWDAVRRMRSDWLDGYEGKPDLVATFDDLDVESRDLVRHHVFVATVEDDARPLPRARAARWIGRDGLDDRSHLSAPLRRALAYADRAR
jgi:NDP-sugar pyrophosphorylase family protein